VCDWVVDWTLVFGFRSEPHRVRCRVDDQGRDGASGKWQRVRQDIRKPLPLESAQFDNV